jgi:hypothetical protein
MVQHLADLYYHYKKTYHVKLTSLKNNKKTLKTFQQQNIYIYI